MSTTTANLGLFKYNTTSDANAKFNINTALNDNWDKIDAFAASGGGSSRNIGEIVSSTVPLVDAGLHLLDGALIQGSGIYSAFVTYIIGLKTTYPDLFTTEALWQETNTNYGVCGKFVHDTTNNTIRLPKITGIIEGTTDLTALGDLIEAGLPNITGSVTPGNGASKEDGTYSSTGALYTTSGTAIGNQASGGSNGAIWHLDASRSSSIYGNSTTVQPQTVKVLYYIVIANSTKTDIQVDIDEIATDLNGKVDKSDLQECQVVIEYQGKNSWYRVWSDGWCEQGGNNFNIPSTDISIYFLKPFKDTSYTIITEVTITGASSYGEGVSVHSKFNDHFLCHGYHSVAVTAVTADWYACGFIEV
jgi:hypothetical protein